jgi:transcriptional regulator with XRE-family HTH domain
MNGKEFKKFLKNNGITQEEAAKVLNLSRRTVNLWCKMEGNITEKRNVESELLSYVNKRNNPKSETITQKSEINLISPFNECLEFNKLIAIIENQSNTITSQEHTIHWLMDNVDFLKAKCAGQLVRQKKQEPISDIM